MAVVGLTTFYRYGENATGLRGDDHTTGKTRQERGSSVCAVAEVLHFQIEGRTGTHPVQEFCTGGSGREGDDKGCAEQAQRKISANVTAIAGCNMTVMAVTVYPILKRIWHTGPVESQKPA